MTKSGAEKSGFDIGNRSLNEVASRIFDCASTHQCVKHIENWLLSKLNCRLHDTLNLKEIAAVVGCS